MSTTPLPRRRTIVIGCVDPRVPPESVLALETGDAAALRNVGGRVTPGLLDELAMLRQVAQAAGGDIGPGWELIVLHHTDCAITRLGDAPELLAGFFGIAEGDVPSKAIDNPRDAVAVDVAALRADPRVDEDVTVSGLVYDVETGAVEAVLEAQRLGR